MNIKSKLINGRSIYDLNLRVVYYARVSTEVQSQTTSITNQIAYFENYIKNAFFEYNNFEFENIEQKGNNLYTCTVTLTDLTGNSKDTKKITIIMQLNDNYDFKMSFSV